MGAELAFNDAIPPDSNGNGASVCYRDRENNQKIIRQEEGEQKKVRFIFYQVFKKCSTLFPHLPVGIKQQFLNLILSSHTGAHPFAVLEYVNVNLPTLGT